MIRNLTEKEQLHLLSNNYIGHLSYIFRNKPFITPITYFFDKENNVIIGYSSKGHKIIAMRKNNNVSMAVANIESVNVWDSILVHGIYEELSGSDAKAQLHTFSLGVKDLIIRKEYRELDFISQFSSQIYKDDLPIVFTIKIEGITGKHRRS